LKSRFLNIFLIVLTTAFISTNATAKSAAFGFFINESKNESFDYLEKILPNSFASTLKNKFDFDIIKPAQIPDLSEGESEGIEKAILKDENLKIVTRDISADYFIYGSFKPLDDNKIKLTINIYQIGTTSVFRFEETGALETEIFKLVDRIAVQIKHIASDSMIYKSDTISSKSKLAILTNAEGEDLNSLYYEFLTNGYKLSPVQGNEIYSLMDDEQINKFYHFTGVNASYHFIHDRKDVELLHGTWSGVEYFKKISEEKQTFEQYSFNYPDKLNEMLKKMKSFNADAIDYIVVIGFNCGKSNAWIRCLDLKNNKLIITETGITGSSIDEITRNIIKSMTTGLPGNM